MTSQGLACSGVSRFCESTIRLPTLFGLLGCSVYWELIEAIEAAGPPTAAWLAEVKAPVLIAWAERDRILPQRGYSENLRAIPGAMETRIDS